MVKKHDLVAVIPARGGSKRLPKKNIIDFHGEPLIKKTLDAAISSNIFDRVFVSTDCIEIAEVVKGLGVDVPFLRDEYADDISTVSDVSVYSIKSLKKHCNEEYKTIVQLMPNCPLRGANDIVKAMDFFNSSSHLFQISCFRYGWMNPWWAHTVSENGEAVPLHKEEMSKRSQDQLPLFCPSGATWIADVNALLKEKTFYGPGYRFHEMSWESAVDIDDRHDLEMALVLDKVRNNGGKL